MTEFITRNNGQKEFEVIIKTDNKDHYKATEYFARKLIDHAKPQTNADRIRAMSDEELANFFADKCLMATYSQLTDVKQNRTAIQIEAEKQTAFRILLKWLKQPVEAKNAVSQL